MRVANVFNGPVVSPLGRVARGGRNWEGYVDDRESIVDMRYNMLTASEAYLAGALAAEAVLGIQKSVIACVKHLVGYEQETNRNPSIISPGQESVSSNIDDRTMHELYLWPFQDAVKAGVASVMCSYQKVST